MQCSYGMLTYQLEGTVPRQLLFYDAFPADSGLYEHLGDRGRAPIMNRKQTLLFEDTDVRKLIKATHATIPEIEAFNKTIKNRPGLKKLFRDVIRSGKALKKLGMDNIYFTIWVTDESN